MDTDSATIDRRTARTRLMRELELARSYAEWSATAQQLDEATSRKAWKEREHSTLYDYPMIRERLSQLRACREREDDQGLVFAIEEGVHGNLGGMGKPMLYNKAYFGTKRLITEFVDEVADTLVHLESRPETALSSQSKLDLFSRASHCYGRSALMLSSGGTLMYFHFGVVKALLEQGVLPNVISGSSAGAIVAAVLATRTDEELKGFFTPENIYFGHIWEPQNRSRSRLRPILGIEAFEQTFDRLIPDLTFREAFQLTGRNISISVSPCERHQTPRLLNAITSPHVLIRSAVRASCAVPGLFEPVQLLARDAQGNTVPYLKSRWIDGVFAADLPAKQLARLYGSNHYIVSYINPVLLLTFRDHKLEQNRFAPLIDMVKTMTRNMVKSSDVMIAKYLPASSVGFANKVVHDLLSQNYVGDINIAPGRRAVSPFKLLSPCTVNEISELLLDGERQTWPRLAMIRNSSKISRTLDGILRRVGGKRDAVASAN